MTTILWPAYPCIGGHIFTWSSSTTNESDPPMDMLCDCGQTEWVKAEGIYRPKISITTENGGG